MGEKHTIYMSQVHKHCDITLHQSLTSKTRTYCDYIPNLIMRDICCAQSTSLNHHWDHMTK